MNAYPNRPILLLPLAMVSNLIREVYLLMPPASSHGVRFLHWLTSKYWSLWHPSLIASTPMPVTLTQPRTESSFSSSRCKPMERRELSDTALPQNERLSLRRWGQPRASTSVAVSERAQQNDYYMSTLFIGAGNALRLCLPGQGLSIPSQHWSNIQSRCPSNMYSPPDRAL